MKKLVALLLVALVAVALLAAGSLLLTGRAGQNAGVAGDPSRRQTAAGIPRPAPVRQALRLLSRQPGHARAHARSPVGLFQGEHHDRAGVRQDATHGRAAAQAGALSDRHLPGGQRTGYGRLDRAAPVQRAGCERRPTGVRDQLGTGHPQPAFCRQRKRRHQRATTWRHCNWRGAWPFPR